MHYFVQSILALKILVHITCLRICTYNSKKKGRKIYYKLISNSIFTIITKCL